MTKEEISKQFKDMCLKLLKEYNVIVMIRKTDSYDVGIVGIGCQACETEVLLRLYIEGQIRHNRDEILQ